MRSTRRESRRVARDRDREAARSAGWSTLAWRDVAPAAWALSRAQAPRRVAAVRAFFTLWSAPFHLAFLLHRRGWFHRDDRRTLAMVRRQPANPWVTVLIVVVASQLALRLTGELVDASVISLVTLALLTHLAVVGIGRWLRRRELTTPEERRGLFRVVGIPPAHWTVTVDSWAPTPWPAVDRLIAARVPPGESVGTEAPSDAAQRELERLGFTATPGEKGHMERVMPAPEMG